MTDDGQTRVTRLVVFALCVGVLLAHSCYYLPFLSDDSLISLRYAARLLQGKGLTWNDGHPVEGYSNLLWILLLLPFGALHVDLVAATRVLGLLCMAGAVACVLARYGGQGMLTALTIGLLFFVGAAP